MNASVNVLVTGGAGFIGSHLVDRLVNEGCVVKVLDDLSSGKTANIEGHLSSRTVELIKGDIRDADLVKEALCGVDVVIHLAAQISVPYSIDHPEETFDVNVAGTQNLLRSCVNQGVKKLVFASSCAVYGDPAILPVNEDASVSPISPYAESKLLGERYCMGFSQRNLIETVVLRFFNVYGCRQGLNQYSGVITQYVESLHKGEPLIVYGDGSQTRDFVNVADVVNAIVTCVGDANANRNIFNIGSGRATSINELAQTILDVAGVDLAVCHESPRLGDIKHSYADISKAQKLLGYLPSVSLRDGLAVLLKEKAIGN